MNQIWEDRSELISAFTLSYDSGSNNGGPYCHNLEKDYLMIMRQTAMTDCFVNQHNYIMICKHCNGNSHAGSDDRDNYRITLNLIKTFALN